MRTAFFTGLALVAFAANSVLCRLALRDLAIDAATFSSVRLAAGAVTLALLVRGRGDTARGVAGSWTSAAVLFLYAVPFSFAYLQLTAGTGALLLFACVQVTMIVAALGQGERLRGVQWLGLGLACTGLYVLVRPGLAAPAPASAALMAVAGVAWGAYSLMGRGEARPLDRTAANFLRAVPPAVAVNLLALGRFHASPTGLLLAAASGSLASGVGYVLWYLALAGLTAARAAIVQLAVPVLAAAGGLLLLGEAATPRLAISTALTLGGIALALTGRQAAVARGVR